MRSRAAVGARLRELIETADQPDIVAATVLKAAVAAKPKLRYPAGARASRLQLLRRFAPAAIVDDGIRKNLRLAAVITSTTANSSLQRTSEKAS